MGNWTPEQYKAYINKPKKNMYNNIRTSVFIYWRGRKQTIWFDSKGEAEYGQELILLARKGEIERLQMQEKFVIFEKKDKPIIYRADFCYWQPEKKRWRIDDFKSRPTAKRKDYQLKIAMLEKVLLVYNFEFWEVYQKEPAIRIF